MAKNRDELNNELHQAILYGNIEQAKSLITEGAEVNPQDTYTSPLLTAIKNRHFNFAKELITDYKAEVNLEDTYINPFQSAVSSGDLDMVQFLLENSQIDQKTIANTLVNFYDFSPEVFEILIKEITDINSVTARIPGSNEEFPLLAAAILRHNSTLVQLLVALGAKVTEGHYEMAKRSYANITSILSEAELNKSDNKEKDLSKAIKYNAQALEQLLSGGVKIDLTDIMLNLSTAVEGNNIQVIDLLLKHNLEINWNEAADKEGNSLLMLIAKKDPSLIKKYISLKDKDGFPIFKINYENNKGEKLIDIIRDTASITHQEEIMQIINLLRECGSAEPKDPIMPKSALDGINVHKPVNEWVVKQKQNELRDKFSSQKIDNESILQEIETKLYSLLNMAQARAEIPGIVEEIYTNVEKSYGNAHPIDELVMEFAYNPKFLEKVKNLISSLRDHTIHSLHNNSWSTAQELAHVFLECKEHPYEMEKFLANLARSIGSPWGMLVHTYRAIENENFYDSPKPITDFDEFVRQEKALGLGDLVVKSLQESGMPNQKIHEILKEFYNDLMSPKSAADYGRPTELVKGLFYKAFTELMIQNGKDVSKIYSLDAKNFHLAVHTMLSKFEYEDKEDYNLFYKFLANAPIYLPELPDYRQEDKILETIFSSGELIKNLTGPITSNIESSVDLWCFEKGYGSKHDEYGALIYNKPGLININIYNSNKYKYEAEAERYSKELIVKLCQMAQKGYGNNDIITPDGGHTYNGIKAPFVDVINYLSEQNKLAIEGNIVDLKIDYIIGEFFNRSLNYLGGINSFEVNNEFINNFAIKDLLQYANQQIHPQMHPHLYNSYHGDLNNFEPDLVGENEDY